MTPNSFDAPKRRPASFEADCVFSVWLIRQSALAIAFIFAWATVSQGAEIAVSEVRWGFDGAIREFAFLPVSILIRNDASTIQKATLRLGRCDLPPTFEGDVYEQEVTLAPHSSRWVQFIPVTENTVVQWHLQYGPDKADFYPLPQPRPAQTVAVLIDSPARRSAPTAIDRFPAELFPVSVLATDSLNLVFLDHAPEFDDVRLQAFREWLLRDGNVVLLHNDDSRFPEFSGRLAELNDPAGLFRVGHGHVQRVSQRARDISASDVHSLSRIRPSRGDTPPAGSQRIGLDTIPAGTVVPKSGFLLEEVTESLCRFRRPWWIIYPVALAYLGVIGPACFFLAQNGNLRGFYLVFLSAVLGTSVLFVLVNRISVGNHSRLRTLAIARQVSDQVWDLRRWTALANVASGLYEIEGSGAAESRSTGSAAFASLQGQDTASVIAEGRYRMLRPTMSTKTFQQKERREFDTPWITLTSNAAEAGGALAIRESLVQLHGPLANLADKSAVGYIQAGTVLQPLKLQKGQLVVDTGLTTMDELFQHRWQRYAYQQVDDLFGPSEREVYLSLLDPMIRYALTDPRTGLPSPPPDGVRVFLLAPLPDELKVPGDIQDQSGYVLFIVDG